MFRAETTYEDIFYLVDQIVTNGEGLKADLTVEAFANHLRVKGRSFLNGSTKVQQAIDLHLLAIDARRYIEKTVASLLRTPNVKGLDLILELAKSSLVSNLDIITLNHDTLVEQLLSKNNIDFADGFGQLDGDIRLYEDHYPDGLRIHLIKPHGSISWWRHGGGGVLQPSNIMCTNSAEWNTNNSEPIKDIGKVPFFLTGVGKVNSYNRGIFADQHFYLQKALRDNCLMIMSGYGWADIAINSQLQNWLKRDTSNTLILLHRFPDVLANSSLELRQVYNMYVRSKQIIPLKQWLSETSISDVSNYL